MASIDGLGSGLDTTTIISQLMSLERQPQSRLVTQRQAVLSSSTAWEQVGTKLATLGAALTKVTTGGLAATTVTSSATQFATVSGTSTATGVHHLAVRDLATAQRVTSAAHPLSDPVGAGALVLTSGTGAIDPTTVTVDTSLVDSGNYTVELAADGLSARVRRNGGDWKSMTNPTPGTGSWSYNGLSVATSGLTAGTPATFSVARTKGATATLNDIAAAVNSVAGGLSAVVVSDGQASPSARLVLFGSQTGSAGTVRLASSYGDPGPLADATLNRAVPDPSDPQTGTVPPTNAKVTIGDLTVERPTNSISDLLPGVTINLVSRGDTMLTVASDSGSSVANAKAAVDALNAVLGQISTSSRYNATTEKTSALTGDGGARRLAYSLTAAVTEAARSVTGKTLSDLGIRLEKTGTYTFDTATFAASLAAAPGDTQALVSSIAAELQKVITSSTGAKGAVTTSKETAVERAAMLQKQIDSWDDKLALIENRLRRQYTSLDRVISSLKSQSTWLSGQLANL